MSDQLFVCPNCGLEGIIDDDQYHGRVSIDCPDCPYHETVNVAGEGDTDE